jgi:hypothetical protein
MSTLQFRMLGAAILTVAVVGVVLLATVGAGDLGRRPWLPVGIVVVAAGAVGLVIMTTMAAKRTEDRSALRSSQPDQGSRQKR